MQKSSLVDGWLGAKYASDSLETLCEMAPLTSFILQYLCRNQFVFSFWKWKHFIEKYLIGNFTRCALIYRHHLRNTTFSKSRVTKNIFNLQEWRKKTWNCKSWFQQIFIAYKPFTVGIKTNNFPRTTKFGLWFHKGVL